MKSLLKHIKAEYGEDRVTDDPLKACVMMQFTYGQQAVEKAGTTDVDAVKKAAKLHSKHQKD